MPEYFTWRGHIVVPSDEPFEMSGRYVQPVEADYPIYEMNFRNSRHQPTRFGWVYRDELEPIEAEAVQTYRAWCQGLDLVPSPEHLAVFHTTIVA